MRLLIEVVERPSTFEVTDSYLLSERIATFAEFRRTERDAFAGLCVKEEWLAFQSTALKLFGQYRRGMMGPGDEVIVKGPTDTRYCFSVLEDAGKRTGEPWQNAYPFGPLSKLMTMTLENDGWPNRVMESRPVPYGVGHDPDGNQY